MSNYSVSVRGPLPPLLGERVAQAHAVAVLATKKPKLVQAKPAAPRQRGVSGASHKSAGRSTE